MNKKLIVSCVGTVFLGIVGTALWQVAVAPISTWFYKTTFSLYTLGLTSLSNNVYQNIAKGLHEHSSLVNLQFVMQIIIYGVVIYILGLFEGDNTSKQHRKEFLEKLEAANSKEEKDQIADKELKRLKARLRWFRSCGILLATIFVAYFILLQSRAEFINAAVTEYEQTRKICKPFMTVAEDELGQSKFAQIQTKQDYIAVMKILRDKAEQNKITLPKSRILVQVVPVKEGNNI